MSGTSDFILLCGCGDRYDDEGLMCEGMLQYRDDKNCWIYDSGAAHTVWFAHYGQAIETALLLLILRHIRLEREEVKSLQQLFQDRVGVDPLSKDGQHFDFQQKVTEEVMRELFTANRPLVKLFPRLKLVGVSLFVPGGRTILQLNEDETLDPVRRDAITEEFCTVCRDYEIENWQLCCANPTFGSRKGNPLCR